jgi:cytochrome c1
MSTHRVPAILIVLLTISACSKESSVSNIDGNPEQGRIALTQYACHACHIIPGITGSKVFVGPSLEGFASRPLIAGDLPNNADSLIAWIRHPKTIDPQTAMPDMSVTEQHARDMAAYLSTLK